MDQMPWERSEHMYGLRVAFRVKKVNLILKGMPRAEIILERISKKIVEQLLFYHSEFSSKPKIVCERRISGIVSHVKTSERLPKEAIRKTSRELREQIFVKKLQTQ